MSETIEQKLARLEAENLALRNKATRPVTLKVSEKGAISVGGFYGKFPVTLYRAHMEKLLDMAPQIRQFIADNADKLATKP